MDASQSLRHDVPDYAMKKAGNLSPAQELCRLLHSGARWAAKINRRDIRSSMTAVFP